MSFPGLGSYDPSALLDLGEYLESDYLDTASLKTDSVTATYTDPGGGIPIPQLRRFDLSNLALGSIAESPSHSPNPFLWSSSSSSSNVNPTSSSLGQKLGGVFLSSSATSSASSAPIQIKQEIPEDVDLMKNLSMFPMEEDDIFQVDKNDLIQGPTLAELNANDESLLGDLNFDDFLLPADSPNPMTPLAVSEDSPDRYPFMASNSNSASFVSKSEHIPNMGLDPTLQSQPFSTAVSSPAPPPYNALLSASYPSRVSHVSRKISETRLGRRQREPPPPYPSTASPHSPSPLSSSPRPRPFQRPSTLQELLTLKSSTEASATVAASASSAPKVTVSGNAHAHGPVTRTTPSPHRPGGVVSPAPSHPAASVLGQSVPKSALTAANPLLLSRLSSSAPTHLGFEQLWQRREPRPHLLSTSSLAEELQGGSTSSLSTVGILSPGSFDFSQDEGFSSEDDSDDQFEDVDDSDSDLSGNEDGAKGLRRHGPKGTASTSRSSTSTKKERYFWQYNVQAKGPKGQRLTVNPTMTDPHVLNEIQDPVFSPHCAVDGVKHRLSLVHSGKARRGDGNDLTPNPRKLHNIGKELDKLNRLINDMTPVSELPVAVRPKSRKEKNKLASRACRLKKKAQHEANKVKLFGLEQEHRRLMSCVQQVQQLVASKWELLQQQGGGATPNPLISQVSQRVELVYQGAQKLRVASESTEFVNRVLERVKNGEPSGGLDEI